MKAVVKTAGVAGAVFVLALWAFVVGCWGVNAYKLVQCDFESPYKGEAVHAIGLVGPLSVFTVWYDEK